MVGGRIQDTKGGKGIKKLGLLLFAPFLRLRIKILLTSFIIMDPKQLEQLKKTLLEEKKKLENELNEIARRNPQIKDDFEVRFPRYGTTRDENALEVAEFEKLKAIEMNLEKKLAEIKETLKKIDQDSYGICRTCLEPIEEPRLKAIPTASLCAVCAKR